MAGAIPAAERVLRPGDVWHTHIGLSARALAQAAQAAAHLPSPRVDATVAPAPLSRLSLWSTRHADAIADSKTNLAVRHVWLRSAKLPPVTSDATVAPKCRGRICRDRQNGRATRVGSEALHEAPATVGIRAAWLAREGRVVTAALYEASDVLV